MSEWPALREEALAIWNENAEFWDAYMGDQGNDFHNELIRPAVNRLLRPRPGMRILELACGAGLYCRELDGYGARVLATDGSAVFLDIARKRNAGNRVEFAELDVTRQAHWTRLRARAADFDAVVCNMMYMDVPCVEVMTRNVAEMLVPGGVWVFSLMHPCFSSAEVNFVSERGETWQRNCVKVYRYSRVEPFHGRGILGQPHLQYYFHRPLETIVGSLVRAGLVVNGLEEPAFASKDAEFEAMSFRSMPEIPPAMIIRALKPGS